MALECRQIEDDHTCQGTKTLKTFHRRNSRKDRVCLTAYSMNNTERTTLRCNSVVMLGESCSPLVDDVIPFFAETTDKTLVEHRSSDSRIHCVTEHGLA